VSNFGEDDERQALSEETHGRKGPGWPRAPKCKSTVPTGLRRAVAGLERAVGALVAHATGEDEAARRIAVGALNRLVANPGGRADVVLRTEYQARESLKAAISGLAGAIGRVEGFAVGQDPVARPIALGVQGRLDAIVVAWVGGSIREAEDATARLRAYRALAELGLRMPEQALMMVLMEIGRHLDDDQEAIAIALTPLTEARRRRRESASRGT
jgi:hypothetical protein